MSSIKILLYVVVVLFLLLILHAVGSLMDNLLLSTGIVLVSRVQAELCVILDVCM